MIEKVNPSHPDKVADRIAGAIVDIAYKLEKDPKIAVEVLIGHGVCHIIAESSVEIGNEDVCKVVYRITSDDSIKIDYKCVKQDIHLANNQNNGFKCGDNGIFKGMPLTNEQKTLSQISRDIYKKIPFDGKYILNEDKLIICQSNVSNEELLEMYPNAIINPLGYWSGGANVDTGGAEGRRGSGMADCGTGGGLHGKELSKADVSVNIYAFRKAQEIGKPVSLCCAIGDTEIDGIPYYKIVNQAREYITSIGGFEKFAEWGLF